MSSTAEMSGWPCRDGPTNGGNQMKHITRITSTAIKIATVLIWCILLGLLLTETLPERQDITGEVVVGVVAGIIAGFIVSMYELIAHIVMKRNRNRDLRVAVNWNIRNLRRVIQLEESPRAKLDQFTSGVRAILSVVETDHGNLSVVEKSAIINYMMPYNDRNERLVRLLSAGGNLQPSDEYFSQFLEQLESLILNPDTTNLHFYHMDGLDDLHKAEDELTQK